MYKRCVIFAIVLFCFSTFLYNCAVADVTQVTTANEITLNFELPQLEVTAVEPNENTAQQGIYHNVTYAACGWVQEPGYPKLPVTRVLLAVPPDAELNDGSIVVKPGSLQKRNGVRLFHSQKDLSDNRHTDSGFYPSVFARIEMDGYIRSQRVITVVLHPVQYNSVTRELRSYSRLTVSIPYRTQMPVQGIGSTKNTIPVKQQRPSSIKLHSPASPFERTFARHILNYSDYRTVFNAGMGISDNINRLARANIGSLMAAPSAPGLSNESQQTRYKLYIDETGIYKVTGTSLKTDWGIDLIGVDPRKLRLTHGEQEIPIYVSGAGDRRFDAEDAIYFLAHSSTDPESSHKKNAYTIWNIYWLSVVSDGQYPSRQLNSRVAQIDASPSDATAVQVPTFRSRVVFEEDHLTNNLEFVRPEIVSGEGSQYEKKHKWFDALDFWFWDGIKNSSEIGEFRLEFPLYDIAKSFDPPQIHVVLQGGTPVTHEIYTSVNSVRIDHAIWESQAQVTLSENLQVWNNLKDASQGETNVLSLTRIDTTIEDDTTRYPYHIYLNRFWVDYTRLFFAVDDQLRFGTPIKTGPSYENGAEKKGVINQFRIDAFLNPDIYVFETDGNLLTAKLEGVDVTRHAIDGEMQARLRALNSGDLRAVPNSTYTATFQVPDTRTTEFIAVSDAGLRTPVQIETVPPSASDNLRSTLNGADYIIIVHARFREAADRLANWRSTSQGGGHRTKVVDINDIYNTFGDGKVHPVWIKNFLSYAYNNWTPPALSYLVLLGDGTYDFRGIDKEIHTEPPEVAGYIPPHYITTDSFGRTSADHWYATVSGYDEFVDFYVGRLSVETVEQADTVVDKIINYEGQRPNGAWRRRIISVADDEVSNPGDHIFKKSLNEIAKDHTRLGYETVEIYLEDVIDEVEANPEQFSGALPRHVARDRIINALGEGAAIAQYAGHGGRIVWTHEAIFGNASVDKVQETEQIPFMLVLSCYNGYFDAPGEPSMAEKMLRKERGGIIGMLSATRLTYGSGNEDLNRIIFDMLFQRDIRQLGTLSFDSKLEYLLTAGTSQLDIMLEYTLFGDPALRIAMAEYEILPAIQTKTVKAGETLKIAPGYVQTARYDYALGKKVFTRNTNFDGDLTVKVSFPGQQSVGVDKTGARREYYSGDVIVTETLKVKRGSYQEVEIDVPVNISQGDAHVEYYAENATEIAVGGDGFTVEVPKILDIIPQVITNPSGQDVIDIFTFVSDDSSEAVSVMLEWRTSMNPTNNKVFLEPTETVPESALSKIATVSSTTARWWKLPQPIPVPTDGSAFRYDIQVTDADGNVVTSDYFRFYPYVYPNLSVVYNRRFSDFHEINYILDTADDGALKRFLTVDIELTANNIFNGRNEAVSDPNILIAELLEKVGLSDVEIEVAFYSGNPDIDENRTVDPDAHLLGSTKISSDDWIVHHPNKMALVQQSNAYPPEPLNVNPIATVSIPISLRNGIHDVFVYVDPVFSESEEPDTSLYGIVLENEEQDNIGYRQLTVSGDIIGDVPSIVKSVDGGIRILTSVGVGEDKPLVLTALPIVSEPTNPPTNNFGAYYLGGTGEVPSLYNKGTTSHLPPHLRWPHNSSEKTEGPLLPVTLPTQNALLGYSLHLGTGETTSQWNTFKLQTPVTVELDFDFTALQQNVVKELFGTDADLSTETQSMETTLNTALDERSNNIGIYLWLNTIANWVRLDSEIKKQTNGSIWTSTQVAKIRTDNVGDGVIDKVNITKSEVNVGTWLILFDTPHTYRLLFIPQLSDDGTTGLPPITSPSDNFGNSLSTSLALPKLEEIARDLHIISYNNMQTNILSNLGFSVDIRSGETPFGFGDKLGFRMSRVQGAGEQDTSYYTSYYTSRNAGNGTIQYLDLEAETSMPQDTWLILLVSPTQFQIEGENSGVLTQNGTPIYGTVGTPFEYKDYGLTLLITQGPDAFRAGDRFLFNTAKVGTVHANTSYLGTITCLYSEDTVPPNIQLTIGDQQHFISGSSVDAAPLIQATLTDPRGIDYLTRPVAFALGRFDAFEPIAETDYKMTQHPGSNQVVLTYNSPELEPGEYQLRLVASDLDGNEGESEIAFQVHSALQLVEPLNYPNPFTRNTTITCELTKPAKSLTVKIYTLTGRLIRKLESEAPSGFIQLKWDGKDDDGNEVANGVYYGKMIVKSLDDEDDQTHILKMMKLK